MFVTVVLLILGLITLGLIGAALVSQEAKGLIGTVAAGFFVITILSTVFASMTAVDARSYGVITAAGKYEKTVGSGITVHAPWAKVEEFTTTNKVIELGKNGDPLKVNFANGGSSDVHGKVTYRIKDKEGIESLWKEFLTPGKVESSLVEPAANSVARTRVSSYTPFDALKGTSQNDMEKTIKDELNKELKARGLEVRSVEIYGLFVDDKTQERINQEAQAKADYNTKLQQKTNAAVDAQKDAQRRGNATPQALCLELLRNWDAAKQGQIPLSMNCGLGSPVGVTPGVK
jgi:regulator of protease activity HflC (stomatin/prohibitin superfamily)